ncbi:hypothetical protein KA005_36980 [bacterium]|nr:hypothetical protein [bacterium]
MENGYYYDTMGNSYLFHLGRMYKVSPEHWTLGPWNIEWAEMKIGFWDWLRIRILHWIYQIEG